MTKNKDYYEYLDNISWKGRLYREKFLYPIINNWIVGRALDVGCGLGLFLANNKNALGVDINEYCVRHCEKIFPDRVRLMKEDQLPFENNTFGTIILDNVLEHLDDSTMLMREVVRVLHKGGRVIILVPGHKGYSRDPDHKRFYNFHSLQELANQHNLKVLNQRSMPLPFLSKLLSFYCYFTVLERQ